MGTLMQRRCVKWKKKNFLFKKSTSIRVKVLKWKDCFIKNNITRNIDATSGDIKTFDTLMERTVAQKDTPFGTKS
jgi:hypothetical protein